MKKRKEKKRNNRKDVNLNVPPGSELEAGLQGSKSSPKTFSVLTWACLEFTVICNWTSLGLVLLNMVKGKMKPSNKQGQVKVNACPRKEFENVVLTWP